MALFDFLTGKSKKVNLTPDISYPTQEEAFFTGGGGSGVNLRDIVKRRVFEGKDLGFGDEYLDKATNPAIKARQTRFREETMPTINSNLSARGLSRSAGPNLATDVVGKAERNTQSDIDELMSKFYQLNEIQKKSDFAQGLGLATGLQDQQIGMMNNRAAASERLSGRTQQDHRQREQVEQQAGKALTAAIAGAVTGGMAGMGGMGMGGSMGGHSLGASMASGAAGGGGGGFSGMGALAGFFGGGGGSSFNVNGDEDGAALLKLLRSNTPYQSSVLRS